MLASDTERLYGTWALTGWERYRQSEILEYPVGQDPVGLITYDPAGFVQVQIIARGRRFETFRNPRDAANAALRGQPLSPEAAEELVRVYASFAGYAGRYEVDEPNRLIRHQVWTGIDPRMVDGVQERIYEFIGDNGLDLKIKPYFVDGVEHSDTISWVRATA